jgi:hypothetical protein
MILCVHPGQLGISPFCPMYKVQGTAAPELLWLGWRACAPHPTTRLVLLDLSRGGGAEIQPGCSIGAND